MMQVLHVSCNSTDHRTVRVIGHFLRAKEHEVFDQFHHRTAAYMKKNSLDAAQEHEEVICSGHTLPPEI